MKKTKLIKKYTILDGVVEIISNTIAANIKTINPKKRILSKIVGAILFDKIDIIVFPRPNAFSRKVNFFELFSFSGATLLANKSNTSFNSLFVIYFILLFLIENITYITHIIIFQIFIFYVLLI